MGEGLRKITCPYHAWTYGLDGCLRAFPGAEAGFDDIDKSTHGLHELPVAEDHGLVFVRADPAAGRFTVDDALHGAEEELAEFGLEHYAHIDTRSHEWAMNWKLVMDTFTEPYHIPWLHKDSIAPYYLFDRWIFDAYGPHFPMSTVIPPSMGRGYALGCRAARRWARPPSGSVGTKAPTSPRSISLLLQPGGFEGFGTLPVALHADGLAVAERPEVGRRMGLNLCSAALAAASLAREDEHPILARVDELLGDHAVVVEGFVHLVDISLHALVAEVRLGQVRELAGSAPLDLRIEGLGSQCDHLRALRSLVG